ncbi:MAG: nucleotidyltransferase domain-containing protein [Bacteroidota bacterium]|nr:nucleotidyltransferase domain-containing protein [Bacteroidota bacterium]
MLTKRALKSLLNAFQNDLLVNGLTPKKLLLFGSYAKGGVHAYSDVDVAVWSDQFTGDGMTDYEKAKPVLKKYPILQAKLYPDFADENNFDPFIGEIKRTGVIIL